MYIYIYKYVTLYNNQNIMCNRDNLFYKVILSPSLFLKKSTTTAVPKTFCSVVLLDVPVCILSVRLGPSPPGEAGGMAPATLS